MGLKCWTFLCVIFNQVASIFHLGKEKIKKVFFWAYLMISGIGIGLEFLRFQDSQSFTGIQEEDVPYLERCLRHSIHFHVIHPRMSPEWGNDPKMTTFGRNETGLIPVIPCHLTHSEVIQNLEWLLNEEKRHFQVISEESPNPISFVGKMFQLWDNGYRWASKWHRMTRKW